MSGLYDVPNLKKCCVNCEHAFLKPRPELVDMKQLGKFPVCTCKHPNHRKLLHDPREEKCGDFAHKNPSEKQL